MNISYIIYTIHTISYILYHIYYIYYIIYTISYILYILYHILYHIYTYYIIYTVLFYHIVVFPHTVLTDWFQPKTATGKLKAFITPTTPRGFHCSSNQCPGPVVKYITWHITSSPILINQYFQKALFFLRTF